MVEVGAAEDAAGQPEDLGSLVRRPRLLDDRPRLGDVEVRQLGQPQGIEQAEANRIFRITGGRCFRRCRCGRGLGRGAEGAETNDQGAPCRDDPARLQASSCHRRTSSLPLSRPRQVSVAGTFRAGGFFPSLIYRTFDLSALTRRVEPIRLATNRRDGSIAHPSGEASAGRALCGQQVQLESPWRGTDERERRKRPLREGTPSSWIRLSNHLPSHASIEDSGCIVGYLCRMGRISQVERGGRVSVAVSDDGKLVAAGRDDGAVTVWELSPTQGK